MMWEVIPFEILGLCNRNLISDNQDPSLDKVRSCFGSPLLANPQALAETCGPMLKSLWPIKMAGYEVLQMVHPRMVRCSSPYVPSHSKEAKSYPITSSRSS